MKKTIWKPLKEFENYYVNIYGDVMSLKVRQPTILQQSVDSKGYMVVNLDGKVRRVHRLVASAFLGLDMHNTKQVVMHLDDNPKNNSLYNLSIGTQKDNVQDMLAKKRNTRRMKISDEDVVIVRKRIAAGEVLLHLAEEYGVSLSLMSAIKYGQKRTNV